jgi:hypothetical protein
VPRISYTAWLTAVLLCVVHVSIAVHANNEQGALWPEAFHGKAKTLNGDVNVVWSAATVNWALSQGCTWGRYYTAFIQTIIARCVT